MPFDTSVPIGAVNYTITPPAPHSILDSRLKAISLRNAMLQNQAEQQNIQTGALAQQQQQYQLDQTRAINTAYQKALRPAPDGTPDIDTGQLTQAVTAAGYGSAVPGILENVQKYKTQQAALTKANGEVAAQQADFAGTIGATVAKGGYDPRLMLTLLTHAGQSKAVDPQTVQPLVQHLTQTLDADPTGAQAQAAAKQIADQLIAASPKQREVMAAEATANAKQVDAATAKAKADAELPGLIADAAGKKRANDAAVQAAAVTDPVQKAAILKGGMTPAEQTTATDTETRNRNENQNEKTRNAIAAGELNIKKKEFDATYGVTTDANGQALAPDALKAAALKDPTAVAIANYRLKPLMIRGALPKAVSDKVLAINPAYDVNKFDANHQTALDYAPGGKIGKQLTSTDIALSHIGQLLKAGQGLDSGNLQVLNKLAQEVGVQTGSDAKTTYDAILQSVSPELSRAVIGEAGGEGDRQAMMAKFSSAQAPQQRNSAIAGVAGLLGARYQKNLYNYKQQMGQDFDRPLSPESQAVLDRLNPPRANGPAAAAPAGSVSVKDPRGGVHVFKNAADAAAFKKLAGLQ